MSENKKNIPEGELKDETLDKVAGGEEGTISNGRYVRICARCREPLPHWYQGSVCATCKANSNG